MKTSEEIRKLAEELIPYNPYNNTLFPGQREREISGFVNGYKLAQSNLEKEIKDAYDAGKSGITFEDYSPNK